MAEITASQEKLKTAEMIEMLHESKQQRSETNSILTNTPYQQKEKTRHSPTPYPVHSSSSTHQNRSKNKMLTKPKPTSQSNQGNI